MTRHSLSTNNHRLESFVYANAAARTAATGFTIDDVARVAYQVDTRTYWRVDSVSGGVPTWGGVNAVPGTPVDETEFDTHVATDAAQNVKGHISYEMLQDMLAAILVGAGTVSIAYSDAGTAQGTITVTGVAADTETIRDAIGTALVAGTGISINVNDGSDTITITNTLPESGGGLDEEGVQDVVGAMLVSGSGISLNYNDGTNKLTITNTGSSSGGGSGETGGVPVTQEGDLVRGRSGASIGSNTRVDYVDGTITIASATAWSDLGNIADGNDATFAETTADMTSDMEIRFDLGQERRIGSFRLACATTGMPYGVSLQWSDDDSDWQTVRTSTFHAPDTGIMLLTTPITARYWRMKIDATLYPPDNRHWKVTEAQLFSHPSVAINNLATSALGAVASMSSVAGGSIPSRIIDGNDDTGAITSVTMSGGPSAKITLPSQKRIVAYRLAEGDYVDGYTSTQHSIEYSLDNSAWTEAHNLTYNGGDTGLRYFAAPVTGRYFRARVQAAADSSKVWVVRQLELYEEPSTAGGALERVPISSNGQILTVVSGMPAWANPPTSTGMVVSEGRPYVTPSGPSWFVPGVELISRGTRGLIASRIYYEPFYVPTQLTLSKIGFNVSATGSGYARVGIYNADLTWQPTSLVLDADILALNISGWQGATINQVLPAGRYMFAISSNSTGTLVNWRGGSRYTGITNDTNIPFQYWAAAAGIDGFGSTAQAITNASTGATPFEHMVVVQASAG